MTMLSLFDRVMRKSLALRNRVFASKPIEIARLCEMMRTSPTGHSDAQDWAMEFADLLKKNVLDRLSKRDLALILAGLTSYRNTGITPQMSHIAMMRAYENSSGVMQELLHKILFREEIYTPQSIKSKFFGEISSAEICSIISELDSQGYVVLPRELDQYWVDAFVTEAAKLNYSLRNSDDVERHTCQRKIDPLNPPKCVAAYANSTDLSASSLFSDFSNDPLLVNLVSRYMNVSAHPIDSTLWYSFPSLEPSADAAQLYHYDLDTLRWVKVFVYLTDVDSSNGPHEYVPASHKPGSKPQQLMNSGYARITDKEIDRYYGERRRVICGKRGTVILGDTRCFHKGNAVSSGYRLIFAPIYAASRIGYFHGA